MAYSTAGAFDYLLDSNKDGSNHKSGFTLTNTSELEIRNMLKQVEVQVNNKKLKWEKQKQEFEQRLRLKEQEVQKLELTIQDKDSEIGQLKTMLDGVNQTTRKAMDKFKQEVKTLEDELEKVRLEYSIMQKKYKKATTTTTRAEPGDAGDHSRANPLATVDMNNNKALAERRTNAQVVHKSGTSYSVRRSGDSPAHAAASSTLRRHESNDKLPQPASTPVSDLMQIQQNEIAKLKAQLDEQKRLGAQLNEEKDRAIKNVDQYKSLYMEAAKKMERSPPSDPVQPAPDSNEHFNINFLRQEVVKRDAQIKDLKQDNKFNTIELQYHKDEVKKYQKQGEVFTVEIEKLKKDRQETLKRLDMIQIENEQLRTREKANEESLKAAELLRQKCEIEKGKLIQELNILRQEVNNYSGELTEKSNKIRSLAEKVVSLEKAVDEGKVKCEKVNHELQMTVAQLDSLRLENYFLKQFSEGKQTEKELTELRKNFDHSEKENSRLRGEVIALTKRLESLKNQEHNAVQARRSYSNQSDIQLELLREENEKKLDSQKQRFESEIKRLNHEMDKVRNENRFLHTELETQRNRLAHFDSDSEKIQEKMLNSDSSPFNSIESVRHSTVTSTHLLSHETRTGTKSQSTSKTNSYDWKKHKRTLENMYDQDIEKIRGSK